MLLARLQPFIHAGLRRELLGFYSQLLGFYSEKVGELLGFYSQLYVFYCSNIYVILLGLIFPNNLLCQS
jgi:hypothetical protein